MARKLQGSGRHDNPDRYGALYASREPVSAVAESIQQFRGQELTDHDLHRVGGRTLALAALDDAGIGAVVDLCDAHELARRDLRPTAVATHDRSVTQRIARTIFDEGHPGFAWWSTLEASWTNVTLFAERVRNGLQVAENQELTTDHPIVREAAAAIGVVLPRRR